MEKIAKYKANDGSLFDSEEDCMAHENNCAAAARIMQAIPDKPKGCDFSNGSGFIQHSSGGLLLARTALLELIKEKYTQHKWIQQSIDKGWDAHSSYAGRIIDECCPNSISKHWYRFMCIDDQYREWGQPYYANNPLDAKQVCLNA